jgi:hypothetical protein
VEFNLLNRNFESARQHLGNPLEAGWPNPFEIPNATDGLCGDLASIMGQGVYGHPAVY